MTEEEKTILKTWLTNMALRIDNDITEARNDFQRDENAWFAFRLALASERKTLFDTLIAQLYALLKM